MPYSKASQIQDILQTARHLVIVQADNPDADSLGSALALEDILGEMGKQTTLYCGVDMPGYLHYLPGWDRVEKEMPKQFDASIIVDASTMTLLEKLEQTGQISWLAAKPCIVLDHHQTVDNPIQFATVEITDAGRASAGELLFMIAQQLQWPLPVAAQEFIMSSILGDTQGLTNQLTSADTYRVMGSLVDNGVDRSKLEELRREYSKMPVEIFKYKAMLISRAQFSSQGAIVSVAIPQNEINLYSPLYNPAPLIHGDMLQTIGVRVAIVFKHYTDGKVTAAIRCNPGAGVGADLAEHFGGGGHKFASGFKVIGGKPFEDVRAECLRYADDLLTKLE
ncbi:MAG: DHH family phosphoesterase [Candidatus Saccharibacteria bacterium]